ncbi:hypothetical protein [Pseudactinotalea sp.]|uniref:hypothetical protein n=1 Tax=Pseudactinotalea sp. TaxID=1926260 RepID=UPI003B3B825D
MLSESSGAFREGPAAARIEAARTAAWLIRLLAVANGIRALWRAVAIVSASGTGGERADVSVGLTDLAQVVTAVTRGDVPVGVGDLPWYTRLLCAAPEVIHAAMLLVAAFLMIAVLREVAQGRSFSGRARRNLAAVSIVLTVGSAVFFVLNAVAAEVLKVSVWGLGVTWVELDIQTFSVPVLLVALGLLAFAFVFALRDGAGLEKDAEGVI